MRQRRTVHLKDWSNKQERTRHAVWAVAYRVLAKDESKQAAMAAVSKSLGIPLRHLRKFCQHAIRITIHENETND